MSKDHAPGEWEPGSGRVRQGEAPLAAVRREVKEETARADVSPDRHVLLHPGEFFGEMSLLDGGPRSASVVADTSVRLLVISRRHFSALLRDVPGLTQTILVTLSRRVREAEERAERLGSTSSGL